MMSIAQTVFVVFFFFAAVILFALVAFTGSKDFALYGILSAVAFGMFLFAGGSKR